MFAYRSAGAPLTMSFMLRSPSATWMMSRCIAAGYVAERPMIVAEAPRSKLSRLQKRPGFVRGNPDELVHLDWSSEWRT
jgi:hypothetical protein